MPRLAPLTPDTATGAARDLLGDLVTRHGTVGPMVATMAHSPAVLGGYLQLSRAMKRAKLPRAVSIRISLAVQQVLGCQVCLAAHVAAAAAAGIPADEIALARNGTSADPSTPPPSASAFRSTRPPQPSPTPHSTTSAAMASPSARSPTLSASSPSTC